jgi:hypothetical protein
MAENSHYNPRSGQRHAMRLTLLPAFLALMSGIAGMTLARHYPLAPTVATALLPFSWVIFFAWPHLWLLALPALLPVIGLAPWTGWITFEEQDILILAVAAGGYAQMAGPRWASSKDNGIRHHRQGWSVLICLLMGLFALATVVSLFRGFADAGGFSFGWFQGYHEPMNSVRLAKSFFLALLLLPLWQVAYGQNPERAQTLLSQGLMLGLATAALTTLWERTAFTGLLNFSADYRTTGMFWEMHVGGAALDGFLALTLPFALRELLIARTPARWGLAATVLALAAYACLTTFSRGVYLAIPVGAVVFWRFYTWQQQQPAPPAGSPPHTADTGPHLAAGALLLAGFGAGAAWIFQTSGYRGMAALLATVVLMLPLARVLRRFNPRQWRFGMTLGGVLVLLAGAIAWLLPKGAYMAWGLAVVLTVTMLLLSRQGQRSSAFASPIVLAGFLATVAATALVANHWGETAGFKHAAPVLLGLLVVCLTAGARRKALWPESIRWQATMAGVMAIVAAIVGVFGGGAYMSERFSTGGQDLDERLTHWQLGSDLLRTPADWLLGKGMGRFPANYFLAGNPQKRPGDYRLHHDGGNNFLTLAGGLHANGFGEIFRVTQRISEPGQTAIVTARVRAEKDVTLHFEVCEKHLLYHGRCISRQARIKSAPGVWQDLRVVLQGDHVTRGDWYAPRLLAFSMAMESRGGIADLDNVALTGADGKQLLTNGDFSQDMAHWFFSSDRIHLPWHIKSMFMNVLFDQGILGVTLWGLLLAAALWRTSLGTARHHPLAPALAASLTGFAVVGLFDTLLDVPRLGWLFYLLLLLALTLRSQAKVPGGTVTDNANSC